MPVNNREKVKQKVQIHPPVLISALFGIFLAFGIPVFFAVVISQKPLAVVPKEPAGLAAQIVCPGVPRQVGIRKPDKAKGLKTAASLDAVTRTLTHGQNVKQLADLLPLRKELFIEAMKENPDQAVFSILQGETRSGLSNISKNCIEEDIQLEGIIEARHVDWTDTASSDFYMLISPAGERYYLYPAFIPRQELLSGMRIKVKGVHIDNHIIFNARASIDQADPLGGFEVIQATTNPPVLGDQKTVVIMANFRNTPLPTLTPAQVHDVVFNQTNPYYQENSYNQVSLSGIVLGWYTLAIDQSCALVDTIEDMAIAAADPDVDYTGYSRVIVVAPYPSSCGWAGQSTLDKISVTTGDGTVNMSVASVLVDYWRLRTVAHELGHGFGNHHAGFYNCGNASMAESGCSWEEYGDWYSVMGNDGTTNAGHYNAFHKEYTGWMTGKIQPVTANGTYTLVPIEIAAGAIQAFKIQRSLTDYLFIEYRQPIGYDVGIDSGPQGSRDVFNGALLHVKGLGTTQSGVIDATPPSDKKTVSLPQGTTFIDPATGGSVLVTEKTSDNITMNITIGKNEFTPPTVSVTAPVAMSTVAGAITASADASDAAGIERVDFKRYSNDFSTILTFASDTSAPYQGVLDTTQIPNGTTYIWATAYDLAGQPYGVSGNYASTPFRIFNIYNQDSIVPSASLDSPTNGAQVTYPLTISATALDNVGIWKVEFSIDTELYTNDFSSPYSITVSLASGSHTVQAKVYDFVGNSALSSVVTFSDATDTTAPTVSLTSPTAGSYARDVITVSATASDNVGVSAVEFFKDAETAPFASDSVSPYAISWDTKLVSGGTHTVKAKAFDAAGNSTESSSISVTVDNTLPTVSLSAPAAGATVSGNVTVSATATDNEVIQRVDFYRDTNVLLGTDTSSPYSIVWNSTAVTLGSHTLYAKATDTAGNAATSGTRTVTVADGLAPTTSITSPSNGAKVSRNTSITISATASDNVAVTKVEFYVNGSLKCTDTTVSYACAWKVPSQRGVTHQLQTRAYDAKNNVGVSSMVSVTSQ